MVMTYNKRKELVEYLINKVCVNLSNMAVSSPNYFQTNDGIRLEKIVFDQLCLSAKNTIFDGTIKHIGGKNFPDITIDTEFGIEVKSTIQDHWYTTGNSVLESSRVQGVEVVYILFGKLSNPIDFRYRIYEECLSEVVVTHYPRYKIDMNLPKGRSIFDKMGISYDVIKNSDRPIAPIVQYYKSKLADGDSLWWVDNGDSSLHSIPLALRLWSNLNNDERDQLIVKSMILFPQIFGSSQEKFSDLQMWLITHHGIVSKSLRDVFSAGGTLNLSIRDKSFSNVPRVLCNLSKYSNQIIREIIDLPQLQVQKNEDDLNGSTFFLKWKRRVIQNASSIYSEADELVNEIFKI